MDYNFDYSTCMLFSLFRRKSYTLYNQPNRSNDLVGNEKGLKSVDHIRIHCDKAMIRYTDRFPNATELTFITGFSTTRDSIAATLTHIIPFNQLTKLVIECNHLSFKKVIELLRFTSNVHTLILETMPFYKNDRTSLQQSEIFRLVSTTNAITNVTFKEKCSIEKFKFLIALCPRLQCLAIDPYLKDLETIIRFLLEGINQNTDHLHSLCLLYASASYLQNVERLIEFWTVLDDYILKTVDRKLYLWW